MGQAVPYTADQLEPEFQKCLYKEGCDGICLQPDPIWDVNLYPYVQNNPVNYIDPAGTIVIVDDAAIAYLVLGGGSAAAGYLMTPQGQQALRDLAHQLNESIEDTKRRIQDKIDEWKRQREKELEECKTETGGPPPDPGPDPNKPPEDPNFKTKYIMSLILKLISKYFHP